MPSAHGLSKAANPDEEIPEAQGHVDTAVARLREAGLDVEGRLGDPDPVAAVQDAHNTGTYDEVIVSTLPGQSSKWIRSDLPHSVARYTGVSVLHVVAQDPDVHPETSPAPAHEKSALGPLSVLAWGGRRP